MKISLLSHPLSEKTPLYGGRGKVRITALSSIVKKDSSNSLFIEMPNHSSTHVDMPRHFIRDGRSITDMAPVDWFFRRILLAKVHIRGAELIGVSHLEKALERSKDCDLLLLKTGFERYRGVAAYHRSPPGLAPELAGYLKKRLPGLRALGMDIISASSWLHRKEGRMAHKEFLSRGVLFIEDMKLSGINKAPDLVVVAPLLIECGDGAPVTVFGTYK